jgi:two-component system sensor histidine kinase CpxA
MNPVSRRFRPFQNLWLFLFLVICLGVCLLAANAWYILRGVGAQIAGLCEATSTAYQHGGAVELQSVQQLLEKGLGVQVFLTDKLGRDLINGKDRTNMIAERRTRRPPFFAPPAARPFSETPSGTCLVNANPQVRFGIPPDLWFLTFLSLACASVAAYITLRMRHIENAVTRFGSGSMGVRIATYSRDPMGRLARSFDQMADRIESLIEGNRRLCVDISHELRSPLARLRLALGLAKSGSTSALRRMETEILRLDELVDILLDTARAETEPDALRSEAISITGLVTNIAADCSIEANHRRCSLRVDATDVGIIRGDPELLRSAIENIVRNAIHHSPEGSTIDILAQKDSVGVVRISVRDRGTGVPDTALEKIFQPFYRVESDRDRKTGGTGLGLAIAKRIITVHSGSVKAENSHPGLRVEVSLPVS